MGEIDPEEDGAGGRGFGFGDDRDGEWGKSWRKFFKTANDMIAYKATTTGFADQKLADNIVTNSNRVISLLISDKALSEVDNAIKHSAEELGDHADELLELLRLELDAISDHCKRIMDGDFSREYPIIWPVDIQRDIEIERVPERGMSFLISNPQGPINIETQSPPIPEDEAIDDINTGIGSIEKFLGKWLPEWALKSLTILKEWMNIVKGGIGWG